MEFTSWETCRGTQVLRGRSALRVHVRRPGGEFSLMGRTRARRTRPPEHCLLCRVLQKETPAPLLPTDNLNWKTTGQSVSSSRLSVPGLHNASVGASFPQWPARSGFRRKPSPPSSAQNRGGGPSSRGPNPRGHPPSYQDACRPGLSRALHSLLLQTGQERKSFAAFLTGGRVGGPRPPPRLQRGPDRGVVATGSRRTVRFAAGAHLVRPDVEEAPVKGFLMGCLCLRSPRS